MCVLFLSFCLCSLPRPSCSAAALVKSVQTAPRGKAKRGELRHIAFWPTSKCINGSQKSQGEWPALPPATAALFSAVFFALFLAHLANLRPLQITCVTPLIPPSTHTCVSVCVCEVRLQCLRCDMANAQLGARSVFAAAAVLIALCIKISPIS